MTTMENVDNYNYNYTKKKLNCSKVSNIKQHQRVKYIIALFASEYHN